MYFISYGIYFRCIQMDLIARDIINILWEPGLDSLSKLVRFRCYLVSF